MNHQSRFDTGSLGLVHWDDPEGWYGEGGGRGVPVCFNFILMTQWNLDKEVWVLKVLGYVPIWLGVEREKEAVKE